MSLALITRKTLRLLFTLWAAVTFVFVILRLSGDPVIALVPPDLPDAIIEVYRARLGLDQPLPMQYLAYVGGVLAGDFGYSFRTQDSALALVASRLPATLLLSGTALLLAVAVGCALGLLAALKRNTAIDRSAMAVAVFGFAMPNFFFGVLLILLFTLTLGWLPSAGLDSGWHLILPALTLGLASAGVFARFMRSSLLEVLEQPYMRTARAKGLALPARLWRHAIPNAALPLITVLGLSVGGLIGGAVVTETVFGWPGVGRLLVVSVGERDLAVVQLLVLLVALTMGLTNLLVDILYGVIDPRVRVRDAAA